jgi:hypothetical protein
MELAKEYTDQLERIKKNVRQAYDYFKENYDRYNEFIRFVFECSLREEEVTLLSQLSKPQLEFNVLEAYISRLLGEFSKQEPDIAVNAADMNKADPMTIRLLEQHLRHTLNDHANHHTRYQVYKDLLAGGFSVLKVSTDYANAMSFEQQINIERVYDPTLCGFDQLARYSHKGDGRFCFELFPMAKDDFMEEYPEISVDKLNFHRDFAGFNWSYLNVTTPTLIIADYYEKKTKRVKIVKLATGETMRYKEYQEKLKSYDGFMPPPAIVDKPRWTEIETIVRYRCIENQILEYVETDFAHLPLIFVDGNSVIVKTPKNGNVKQVTRPYVYHAKGAQRLKNFAGISLANEIENLVQHKFKVSKESLPKEEEFLAAYKDVQKASVLVYNEFYENNPDARVTPPQEVQRVQTPPEIVQAFVGADSLIQNILGSYDAQLGINNNQLSGIAIVEAATQSNAAAMPYIVGLLLGLQRAAEIYVDLLPKYYTTPRTMPITDEEGHKNFVMVNQPNGMKMKYDSNALNVVVKAGASFTVQKMRTLMMVKELAGMSPLFAEMVSTKGLGFILDNMEGRGIEQLKQMADQWVQEYEQQKQAQMQMAQQQMQNDPRMLKAKTDMVKAQMDAKSAQDEQHVKIFDAELRHNAIMAKADAEKARAEADIVLAKIETHGKLQHESMKLHHDRLDMAHSHAKNIADHHLAKAQHEHAKKQGSKQE